MAFRPDESRPIFTETTRPLAEMGYVVVDAAGTVIDAIQNQAGITWQEANGSDPGGYIGLDEAVTAVLGTQMPRCERAVPCNLRAVLSGVVEAQVNEGVELTLMCTGSAADQLEEADAKLRCTRQHRVAADAIGTWMVNAAAHLTEAEITLDMARHDYEAALRLFSQPFPDRIIISESQRSEPQDIETPAVNSELYQSARTLMALTRQLIEVDTTFGDPENLSPAGAAYRAEVGLAQLKSVANAADSEARAFACRSITIGHLSKKRAAELLGVHQATIARWVREYQASTK